jgi:hypothetical protein
VDSVEDGGGGRQDSQFLVALNIPSRSEQGCNLPDGSTFTKQYCGSGSGSGRIRTFLVGSGSGRLRLYPDPYPGLKK